jgi:ABC-type branched-subunit amino acid transport system substrate-binding protein
MAWRAYKEKYGSSLRVYASYGPPAYESMAVLLDAIKRAYEKEGQITREGVVREVAATKDRPGILGFNVSFDEKGDAIGASFYIFQVVGNHFELVKKVEIE